MWDSSANSVLISKVNEYKVVIEDLITLPKYLKKWNYFIFFISSHDTDNLWFTLYMIVYEITKRYWVPHLK